MLKIILHGKGGGHIKVFCAKEGGRMGFIVYALKEGAYKYVIEFHL